jgi:hypothetical protein
MASWPKSEAFHEPWIDAVTAGASFVAEAWFEGTIVATEWPRIDVMQLLPTGLSLVGDGAACADVHPVLFVCGTQSAAALVVGGVGIPSGVSFPELLIVVPFVRRAGDAHLHVFVPRAYSGDPFSTWSGRANYGFEKELAEMRWLGSTFTVTSRNGPLLLHVTTASADPWRTFDREPDLAAVSGVFRRPVLGRRRDGTDVRSYFDWRTDRATARPARAIISIDAPLGPGLAPRIVHGIDGQTFAVRDLRWRVSWPLRCDV